MGRRRLASSRRGSLILPHRRTDALTYNATLSKDPWLNPCAHAKALSRCFETQRSQRARRNSEGSRKGAKTQRNWQEDGGQANCGDGQWSSCFGLWRMPACSNTLNRHAYSDTLTCGRWNRATWNCNTVRHASPCRPLAGHRRSHYTGKMTNVESQMSKEIQNRRP